MSKFESGGETESWGDRILEFVNRFDQWDDERLLEEVYANQEVWIREHDLLWE